MGKIEKKREIEEIIRAVEQQIFEAPSDDFIYPQLLAQKVNISSFKLSEALFELSRRGTLIVFSVPRIRDEIREDMSLHGIAELEEFLAINNQFHDYEFLRSSEIKPILAFKKSARND